MTTALTYVCDLTLTTGEDCGLPGHYAFDLTHSVNADLTFYACELHRNEMGKWLLDTSHGFTYRVLETGS